MDEDFLLTNTTARRLYHEFAAPLPIVDYHSHIDARDIYEDRVYPHMTALWLGGDHYKWRAMRSNGVPERLITRQDSTPYEKFEAWAATLPRAIGNPLYHWTHLELQRYFGITTPLSPDTTKEIWEECNRQLPGLSARTILKKGNVRVLCTTDDPADDLEWHQKLQRDRSLGCTVLPTFRPDRALAIDKEGFPEYLQRLGKVAGVEIADLDSLQEALANRLNHFMSLGCVAADHGLDEIPIETGADAGLALKRRLRGEAISRVEADAYRMELLAFLSMHYRHGGRTMQLHVGALRNVNPRAFEDLGPDSGFDAIGGSPSIGARLGALLGHMQQRSELPRTILYSVNPADNAQIAALIGCFQNGMHAGKMQHGPAWWFNDSKRGMEDHLQTLASMSLLGNFVGMTTDSRSLLSFTRHEYFRRILCNLLGRWVEQGEYPDDWRQLQQLVQDICYHNAIDYFEL